jgi:OOP family OmpA-OmpF porin
MKNRCLLGAGAVLAMALGCAQASAQLLMLPPGPKVFYFGGEGGWTSLGTLRQHMVPSIKQSFDDGYNAGARLGFQWGPWRLEEEYSYRNNGLNNATIGNLGPFGSGILKGSRRSHAIMTNLLYDFTFGWPVTPHIGGGIGAVNVVDSLTLNPVTIGAPVFRRPTVVGGSLLHGSDWKVGYQGIAGIQYNINPRIALDLDYRYLGTFGAAHFTSTGLIATKYFSHYSTHNVVASLIVRFGPPPPPPAPPPLPPAPPPPPVRQVYLVFFDWDRYNITPEGAEVIRQAAAHWHSGAPVRIEVTGYTDLSGSAGYNLRLSLRRANAVATELEGLGVPRNEMEIRGLGMENPRVPTARGVREPQNRRVEIVFP